MTIHELLATQLEVVRPDKIEKKVQTQPKWKCFTKPRIQDKAWKGNGSSKCKIEKETIVPFFYSSSF